MTLDRREAARAAERFAIHRALTSCRAPPIHCLLVLVFFILLQFAEKKQDRDDRCRRFRNSGEDQRPKARTDYASTKRADEPRF